MNRTLCISKGKVHKPYEFGNKRNQINQLINIRITILSLFLNHGYKEHEITKLINSYTKI
jgi:hypothetical protein